MKPPRKLGSLGSIAFTAAIANIKPAPAAHPPSATPTPTRCTSTYEELVCEGAAGHLGLHVANRFYRNYTECRSWPDAVVAPPSAPPEPQESFVPPTPDPSWPQQSFAEVLARYPVEYQERIKAKLAEQRQTMREFIAAQGTTTDADADIQAGQSLRQWETLYFDMEAKWLDAETRLAALLRCNCASTAPTMPLYRTRHLPTCPLAVSPPETTAPTPMTDEPVQYLCEHHQYWHDGKCSFGCNDLPSNAHLCTHPVASVASPATPTPDHTPSCAIWKVKECSCRLTERTLAAALASSQQEVERLRAELAALADEIHYEPVRDDAWLRGLVHRLRSLAAPPTPNGETDNG